MTKNRAKNRNESKVEAFLVVDAEEVVIPVNASPEKINQVVKRIKDTSNRVGVKLNPAWDFLTKQHEELTSAVVETDFYAVNAATC